MIETEYQDFKASTDMVNFINDQLHSLERICPISSCINLKISLLGEVYSASLTVCCPSREFEASATDESVAEVVIKVMASIQGKIRQWKLVRFSS